MAQDHAKAPFDLNECIKTRFRNPNISLFADKTAVAAAPDSLAEDDSATDEESDAEDEVAAMEGMVDGLLKPPSSMK